MSTLFDCTRRWLAIAAIALAASGSARAQDENAATDYVIGTANDEFGLFPFFPWDVIDPETGANIGLDGQFVHAICDANPKMECQLVGINYSGCWDGDSVGMDLREGTVDACASWGQTPARVAVMRFGAAVQTIDDAPRGFLLRRRGLAELPDSDTALDGLQGQTDIIGYVSIFFADAACLANHYPSGNYDPLQLLTPLTQGQIRSQLDGTNTDPDLPYLWATVGDMPDDLSESQFDFAHAPGAVKNEGGVCAGPFALMGYEDSDERRHYSKKLSVDSVCGASLLAMGSEEWGQDNDEVSDTDFRDAACGQPIPNERFCTKQDGTQVSDISCITDADCAELRGQSVCQPYTEDDHRELCAYDHEIPPVGQACPAPVP